MPEFVLVHGSGQHAGCWSRVGSALRARGHTVAAPDLPKQRPDQGLADHAARIAESVSGPGTVVVAHSFCGALLPLVPPIRDCALLVFLAAVIPEPGKSVRQQFTEDPSMFCPAWIAAGPRWSDESQKEGLATEFLFHDCDAETRTWALSTMGFLDTRNLVTQPSPFAKWPEVPAVAVVATGDKTLSPDWIRRASRRVFGRDAIEVHAGHCPHVSQPIAIANLLEQLAHDGIPPARS